jgi:hypothetical protein
MSTAHVNGGVLQIEIQEPLASLIAGCAVFCVVDCCNLDAFDVNAYTMLWWIRDREQDADEARRQLDLVIDRASAHDGPVTIDDFCFEWPHGGDCAEYLKMWHDEFTRALRIGPQGTPPEQRLREAAGSSRTDFVAEVYRMANETAAAVPTHPCSAIPEHRQRALNVLITLARLDPSDEGIRLHVEYARRVLHEQGLSW